MKKSLLFFLLLFPLFAWSNGIEIGGIHYLLGGDTATVTYIGDNYYTGNNYSGEIVIPDSVRNGDIWYRVTTIGENSFYGCSSLTSVIIPLSVTSIGDYAFNFCTSLTAITIPENVTSIGWGAFLSCHNLTSITIPNGITSIGGCTFQDCYELTSITIPNSVTSIGRQAFHRCLRLTSIIIPDGVTTIDDNAFSYCSTLTSIVIPESVTNIGALVFSGCSLVSIVVDPANLFYDSRNNCNAIVETSSNTLHTGCMSTVIPESITSIGDYAFSGCSDLTSIIIPESVSSIGSQAFSGCSLTTIKIPSGVTSIKAWTFLNCSNLTSIIIPQSVTSINNQAFSGCSSLTDIIIPAGVTSIGDFAFMSCSGLISISSMAPIPPACGMGCFDLISHNIPLYVPSFAVNAYKAVSPWNEFDVQSFVTIDSVSQDTTQLSWQPIDSASLYQLHIYTDSTCTITLDTTLYIAADSLNGGILQQTTSAHARIKRIVLDDIGTVVVISIDPSSGSSVTTPFIVTVSTTSNEEILFHFDINVYSGDKIIKEDYGIFKLNDSVSVPTSCIDIDYYPTMPTCIFDLQGHQYSPTVWSHLPSGVYIWHGNGKATKIIKR